MICELAGILTTGGPLKPGAPGPRPAFGHEPERRLLVELFHSAFHVTLKLAPSDARADGCAVTGEFLVPFLVVTAS